MKCPYCGKDVHLVTGEEIYPHRDDLHNKNFWLCEPCSDNDRLNESESIRALLTELENTRVIRLK